MKDKAVCLLILLAVLVILPSRLGAESDKIRFKGDFRYRFESIDKEDGDTQSRHRIRMRLGLEAHVNDQIDIFVELASGSNDPVSNNQTLTDGFSTKDIMLNKAYAEWHPEMFRGLSLMVGKTENPFLCVQKSELLWDPDLSFEGLAGQYKHNLDEFELFANCGVFVTKERSADKDSWFFGGQGGVKIDFADGSGYLTVGGGYVDYANTEGFPPFYKEGESSGNSVDDDGNYREDFNELDLFMETGARIGTIPVSAFGDYVNNIAADDDNNGWLIGVSAGKTKDPGSWMARYQYKYMEKDAVLGQFTDSDFIGGGTDGKGHEFNFDLQVMKAVTVSTTLFLNKLGLDEKKDYTRFQGDLKFKF